jgi:DNA processing protein
MVIVEAGDHSGSLSAGWEALRLGRRLFIVRSAVEKRGSSWPTEMLRYGAEVLTQTQELIATLPETGEL